MLQPWQETGRCPTGLSLLTLLHSKLRFMGDETHSGRELALYWREPELEDTEVLHVDLRRHAFERHSHEGFATSVIDRGAGSFWYRGETRYAPAGSVVLLDPEVVHTGEVASTEGWQYRILYPKPGFLERVAAEVFGKSAGYHFPDPVIRDRRVASCMDRLHCALYSGVSTLERESLLVSTYAVLLSRYGSPRHSESGTGRESAAVVQAREYLEECYAQGTSLRELSEVVGLSRYHLVRSFGSVFGMPPHAYLTQVRLRRAREFLAAGKSIGDTAQLVGFTDQSHLTHRFKGAFGITPGQFARQFAV